MQLKFSAGNFEIETWTNGHPNWMEIRYAGRNALPRFHHNELKDLAYVIERMRNAGRAAMSDNFKHEYD